MPTDASHFRGADVADPAQSTAAVDRLWADLSKTRADTMFREIIEVFQNKADQKFGVGLNGATSVLKQQLLKALVVDSDQLEASRNFLLKLISKDLEDKYHIKLAFQILRIMVKSHDWDRYLITTLRVSRATDGNDRDRGNGLLHEAAKTGHCKLLEPLLEELHVNMLNSRGETPLHLAAEYGHGNDVKILLNKGAELKQDQEGCTPLHSAALSMEPNKDVARLLIAANPQESLLNARHHKTEDTALHCAARNRNVTAEFIEELCSLDPLLRNRIRDTAFHVAAKSDNPKTFMAMMSTFAPTKCGWDVDDADYDSELVSSPNDTLSSEKMHDEAVLKVGQAIINRRRSDNLIDICARHGNAQAVASLIQNGADIRKGIFHTIIEESVRKPEKIEELKAVYHAITENVVLWHYLEKNEKCPMKHSDTYKECLRTELIQLTTDPPEGHHSKMGAIDYAIRLGAGDMLMGILNTRYVYRFDEFGKPHHFIQNKQNVFFRYDVTNFVSATMSKSAVRQKRQPYLSQIVDNCEIWRQTDILNQQPFKKLVEPFIGFIQLLYSLLALCQLLYMIWFTQHNLLPDGYKSWLNASDICGDSDNDDSIKSTNESVIEEANNQTTLSTYHGPSIAYFILVCCILFGWPIILIAVNSIHLAWFCVKQLCKRRKANNITSQQQESLLTTIVLAVAGKAGIFVFSFAVFATYSSQCNETSVFLAPAIAVLSGWLTAFSFFSGVTKEFKVFSLLLRDVIVKDILFRFVLVFVFTIIAFSFSIHILRQTVDDSTDVLGVTVFQTFLSSFGLGDDILNDATHSQGSIWMKIVFVAYNCVMIIILLNVLIAMVNTRYEDARQRAENEWRFGVVSAALGLHDRRLCRRLTRMEESVICCRYCCFRKYSRIYPDSGSHINEADDTIKYNSEIEHYDDRYFMDVSRVDR